MAKGRIMLLAPKMVMVVIDDDGIWTKSVRHYFSIDMCGCFYSIDSRLLVFAEVDLYFVNVVDYVEYVEYVVNHLNPVMCAYDGTNGLVSTVCNNVYQIICLFSRRLILGSFLFALASNRYVCKYSLHMLQGARNRLVVFRAGLLKVFLGKCGFTKR